jgi:hypothetical protein
VAEEEHVGLVGHADLREAARLGEGEGRLADALDSFAGVDLDLLRDLVGRALLEDAADAGVEAFV